VTRLFREDSIMTLTEPSAADLRRLVAPPPPPSPPCWCCGRRDRLAVTDVFTAGWAIRPPCRTSNPAAATSDERAIGAVAAFLTAESGPHLAEQHHGRPEELRALMSGVGQPLARAWVREAADEARVAAWVDSGHEPSDVRFEHLTEDQVDVIERVIATESGELARLRTPPDVPVRGRSVVPLAREGDGVVRGDLPAAPRRRSRRSGDGAA
jgi:hypothetical protein